MWDRPHSRQKNEQFVQAWVEYRERALIEDRFQVQSWLLSSSTILGKSFDLYGARFLQVKMFEQNAVVVRGKLGLIVFLQKRMRLTHKLGHVLRDLGCEGLWPLAWAGVEKWDEVSSRKLTF